MSIMAKGVRVRPLHPGNFGMGVPPQLPGQMQGFPPPPHTLNMGGAMGGLGAVVLISNLNKELVTADNLFNVVGQYPFIAAHFACVYPIHLLWCQNTHLPGNFT